MKIEILVFVAAQTQAQGAFQREALSLWSHLRQVLHLISWVKISCWHCVVQGDGEAVSSSQQNTAVSTDDTAKANQLTSRTGLKLALCWLFFFFFCPLVNSDQLLLQKKLVNWARGVPLGTGGIVSSAVQYSSATYSCQQGNLPGTASATPPTDQGIWHRNGTGCCILNCVFLSSCAELL